MSTLLPTINLLGSQRQRTILNSHQKRSLHTETQAKTQSKI